MDLSKLKLSPDHTELIVFGSNAQCKKLSSHFRVDIVGDLLHPTDILKHPCMWLYVDFSF